MIRQECKRRDDLDSALIAAIIEVESSFNTYSIRYEPNAMRVVAASSVAKMNRITEETEVMAQKFSWGLGQVLGSTARWLGFKGLLSELCEPKTGIFWCCEAFQRLSSRYKEIDYQIAAYNAGSLQKRADGSIVNQKYIDKVLKLYTKEPKT